MNYPVEGCIMHRLVSFCHFLCYLTPLAMNLQLVGQFLAKTPHFKINNSKNFIQRHRIRWGAENECCFYWSRPEADHKYIPNQFLILCVTTCSQERQLENVWLLCELTAGCRRSCRSILSALYWSSRNTTCHLSPSQILKPRKPSLCTFRIQLALCAAFLVFLCVCG